ncbi:hypothetical protein [Planomonospora sphaerica]|uniref:hypothetical protein n=1 Tax=Planomonospora sphaerica TaxID=161355 RepID=UPI001290418E|nr:hypothetical protein [Planomonospora sphaerica]
MDASFERLKGFIAWIITDRRRATISLISLAGIAVTGALYFNSANENYQKWYMDGYNSAASAPATNTTNLADLDPHYACIGAFQMTSDVIEESKETGVYNRFIWEGLDEDAWMDGCRDGIEDVRHGFDSSGNWAVYGQPGSRGCFHEGC